MQNNMMKKAGKPSDYFGFIIVLLSVLLCGYSSTSHAEHEYTFGVFPYLPSKQALKIYGPVVKDLEANLNIDVRLKSASNFSRFEKNLEQEIYDIAVIQPFDYPAVVDEYHYVPIARMKEDLVTGFIIRDDAEISSIESLLGKRIAFPPERSANAQMGLAHLRSNGLDPSQDVIITFQKSHESCLQQVWLKNAVACVTAKPMVDLFERKRNVKFKVLASTAIIPHVLYVAHERVPETQRKKLLSTIINWNNSPQGQEIVRSMGFSGFVEAKDAQYQIMRDLSRQKTDVDFVRPADVITLGVFPYFPPRKMAQLYGMVPKKLSRILDGKRVVLRTAKSYEQFNRNIANNAYDIVIVQPFDYQRTVEHGFEPVARVSGEISASVFVKTDSPIKRLEDLIGKTVNTPPRNAAVTRLFVKELKRRNIVVGKDIFLAFKKTHISCLTQVVNNMAIACVSAKEVLEMLGNDKQFDFSQIFHSTPVPHLVMLVSDSLPGTLKQAISREVISWKSSEEGRRILNTIRLNPFIAFNESDYEIVMKEK